MSVFEKEITELHQFFQDWFAGKLEKTEGVYARFKETLSPSMHLISPDGKIQKKNELCAVLWNMHGSTLDPEDHMRIWVKNVELRYQCSGSVSACADSSGIGADINSFLVTYEEWQERHGNTTSRISSALFCEDSKAPNGLLWVHVHETSFSPKET